MAQNRIFARLMRHICFLLLLALRMDGASFFVQLSDPQFGMYANDANFVQETANFEFVVANVNRLRPAFVVVCGDLVNKPGDAAQLSEYRRIAGKLDQSIPLYNVAGNHDVGNEPTPASLAAYRHTFGPDYYTFQSGDLFGFVLDSSLIQHPEKAPEEAAWQDAWFAAELEKDAGAGRQLVVFQHIPWFLEREDEPAQYFNIPPAARVKYLALFRRYGVKQVFAGHYHRNALGEAPGVEVITTGPVSKPIGPDPSGIRIVKMGGAKLESEYYGLGRIPSMVGK